MSTRTTALATTAGAAAMALIAAGVLMGSAQAQPLAAGSGHGTGNGNAAAAHRGTDQQGTVHQNLGQRNVGQQNGTRHGAGNGLAATASGRGTTARPVVALTAAQMADLQGMVEEEKLAGDVYAALAAQYDDAELAAIAASEDRHAAALRTLLARYGVSDPTAGSEAGTFPTASVQALYDGLLARGSASLAAAYTVGAEIEQMDIDDLTDAISGASGVTDVTRVYTNLRTGSQHHLAAFTA